MPINALIIDFDDTLSNRKQSAYNFYKFSYPSNDNAGSLKHICAN